MARARRRATFYQEAAEMMNDERLLEQEILASFERDEWKPVRNQKGEIAQFRAAAEATLLKNKRVNIRISSRDLEGLQARAAEEGVPYQTLMASVLHKFVSGRLVEAQRRMTTRSSRTSRKRTTTWHHVTLTPRLLPSDPHPLVNRPDAGADVMAPAREHQSRCHAA